MVSTRGERRQKGGRRSPKERRVERIFVFYEGKGRNIDGGENLSEQVGPGDE